MASSTPLVDGRYVAGINGDQPKESLVDGVGSLKTVRGLLLLLTVRFGSCQDRIQRSRRWTQAHSCLVSNPLSVVVVVLLVDDERERDGCV